MKRTLLMLFLLLTGCGQADVGMVPTAVPPPSRVPFIPPGSTIVPLRSSPLPTIPATAHATATDVSTLVPPTPTIMTEVNFYQAQAKDLLTDYAKTLQGTVPLFDTATSSILVSEQLNTSVEHLSDAWRQIAALPHPPGQNTVHDAVVDAVQRCSVYATNLRDGIRKKDWDLLDSSKARGRAWCQWEMNNVKLLFAEIPEVDLGLFPLQPPEAIVVVKGTPLPLLPAEDDGGSIVCEDGYVWPSATRQGACHGHGGIKG